MCLGWRYIKYKVLGKNWEVEPCESFISQKNDSSLIVNLDVVKPEVFNILEIKLRTYLIAKGSVSFTYKRKSKQEIGYVNGQLRFFLNSKAIALNNSHFTTEPETFSLEMPKGANELTWRFVLTTAVDFSSLSFEFTVSFIRVIVEYWNYLCCSCSSNVQSL